MSTRTPRVGHSSRDEAAQLQYETEHVSPKRPHSIYRYLVILAAVAFLLLLMAYLMQLRNNKVAIDSLQQSSNSAVQSVENLIAERDGLQSRVRAMEDQESMLAQRIEVLEQAIADANRETTAVRQETQLWIDRVAALNTLNEIRALYNRNQYRAARALLGDDAQRAALRSTLEDLTDLLSPEEQEYYDPLAAYQTLCGWLGVRD